MNGETSPRRSSGRPRSLFPIALAIGAVLVAVVLFRFGTDASIPSEDERNASPTVTGPVESLESDPADVSEAEAVAEEAPDETVADRVPDDAEEVSDTAAVSVDATDAPASDIPPSDAPASGATNATLAIVEPDAAASDAPSPGDVEVSNAEPDLAAAAPMIEIDAPDLQGLAELATLTTLPDTIVGDADLPSVDDPMAGKLFGSPVILVSSATPRVVMLANGTSLVPGATLPSGHRLVAIERERILLERDGVEWRLRVP